MMKHWYLQLNDYEHKSREAQHEAERNRQLATLDRPIARYEWLGCLTALLAPILALFQR